MIEWIRTCSLSKNSVSLLHVAPNVDGLIPARGALFLRGGPVKGPVVTANSGCGRHRKFGELSSGVLKEVPLGPVEHNM